MSHRRKTTWICSVTAAFLILLHPVHAYPNLSGWQSSIVAGYGFTHAVQTQNVRLADTPAPGLVNRYVGGNFFYGSALLGIALEKEVKILQKDLSALAGIELDYMRNLAVNGTVKPMYNVSPNFDELKFFYDTHTIVALLSAKLSKNNLIRSTSGYLQAGAGLGINRISDYREYPPTNSTASPMLLPFRNRDILNPAFSAGAGLSFSALRNHALSIGYRFFYTGRGRLAKSPVQQTNASIVLSPITYNFLILSVGI